MRLFLVIFSLVSFCVQAGDEGRKFYTSDSLRDRLNSQASERDNARSRLKTMSSNPAHMKMLRGDKPQYYRLPNGEFVRGMMLPNNKLSPAIKTDKGLKPACVVDESYQLIIGSWNQEHEAIECPIEQHKLAVINSQKQLSIIENNNGQVSVSKNTKSKNKRESVRISKNNSTGQTQSFEIDDDIYIPPFVSGGAQSNATGAVLGRKSKKFGINIGTWAKCSLPRSVSSSESGVVEFTLQEPLFGRYKEIPAGTTLFADKRINVATERLEAFIKKALTPDDQEYDSISATIYSLDKTAGLTGELVRDREGEMGSAASNAALSGLGAAVPNVSGNVSGAVVNSFTSDMIQGEQRYVQKRPSATINVSPQNCLIKITKSF